MSYKADVIADSSGKWCNNALRFAARKEADDNVGRPDRQRLAVCHAKLDDIGAVALRTVDHDAVLAARRSHAHLRRSFDQSSSASRFTAGAAGFFILSQSGERPER
jgi:hypothetical protein